MHPPADRIVHQLKYRGWSALAEVMAEPMADAVRTCDVASGVTCVISVSTTEARLRDRGYNQAELLAREVAKRLDMPFENFLERTGSKGTQTTLQPAARGANVAGAFRLRPDSRTDLAAARILIVDDVMTTGATTLECARTFLDHGARRISVLTYARAVDSRRLLGGREVGRPVCRALFRQDLRCPCEVGAQLLGEERWVASVDLFGVLLPPEASEESAAARLFE